MKFVCLINANMRNKNKIKQYKNMISKKQHFFFILVFTVQMILFYRGSF